ncbi:MAG: methionyl-tRNA formyltransferase [Candidatus Cyclobacteriaceae bacterium M3_2C_046]
MPDLRIIFMGTPHFAVPSLEILLKNGFNVVGVITAPDKPRGRGQKLMPSPVKQFARKHQLPVMQPTNLKSPGFLQELKAYQANLQVVVAFRMLPQAVWEMPQYGTFNLHASLLPQYRGAAPINWAIMNGEAETGVTTFFIQQEIDTGKIINQEKVAIGPEEDAGQLHDRLMVKGAELVLQTVVKIAHQDLDLIPQDQIREVKQAPKLQKETCKVDWNQPSEKIRNFIRGLSPYPAAWTVINQQPLKIFKTTLADRKGEQLDPGQHLTDQRSYLYIKTADGLLKVEELQVQGKKRMDIQSFLRGNNI